MNNIEWETRLSRELLHLAWPIAISMVSYSVMTFVDTVFVSTLGESVLAGVGMAGIIAITLMCFGFGLSRGLKTLISQARGAGNLDIQQSYLAAGLYIGAAIGIVILLLGAAATELIPYISKTIESSDAGQSYLMVRIIGSPLAMIFAMLREYRYGTGDTRSPMIASVIANAINIGFDYLFIMVLGLGPAGAAWATVISQVVGLSYMLLLQAVTDTFGFAAMRMVHVVDLLKIGFPTGVQFLLEVGSFATMAAILSYISDTEMAAHQIAIQLIHFGFMPASAIGEAANVLTGQAVGAGRMLLVRRVAMASLKIAIAYGLFCGAIFFFFRGPLVGIFGATGALQENAKTLLIIAGLFQIFDAALIVAYGVLRGTGDVRVPAIIGIATSWLLTPTMSYFLGLKLGYGATGAWLGVTGEILIICALLWWRLLAPFHKDQVAQKGWVLVAEKQRRVVVS